MAPSVVRTVSRGPPATRFALRGSRKRRGLSRSCESVGRRQILGSCETLWSGAASTMDSSPRATRGHRGSKQPGLRPCDKRPGTERARHRGGSSGTLHVTWEKG